MRSIAGRAPGSGRFRLAGLGLALLALAVPACSSSRASRSGGGLVRLYTSVTQETVDAVVAGFTSASPGSQVQVFRAPTGELNARIASEQRSGGVKGDVVWATDPLTMHGLDAQGLLATDFKPDVSGIPGQYRTDHFWGTRVLDLVIVETKGLQPAASSWLDLASSAYTGAVEIPDPGFAGSAFAALGYFADTPGFGIEFLQRLKDNGTTQVESPTDVVTDVAEGRAKLGITLDFSARDAEAKGSPVQTVWPQPGAIAVYSPIALFGSAEDRDAAESFVRFVLSAPGQQALAGVGWQPVREGIAGPPRPAGAREVSPNWPSLFERQDTLLEQYRCIFGG